MDRFEEESIISFNLLSGIYIPVWIDLKNFTFQLRIRLFIIYIPVWIDLKVFFTINKSEHDIIYIPVWIDLKMLIQLML